jgi:hypothetical protein
MRLELYIFAKIKGTFCAHCVKTHSERPGFSTVVHLDMTKMNCIGWKTVSSKIFDKLPKVSSSDAI